MEQTHPFNFQWMARWKDGSCLTQFKKEGGENLARAFLEDNENVKEVSVVGLEGKEFEGQSFTVDLETGILIAKVKDSTKEYNLDRKVLETATEKPIYRIIYFRRNAQSFGPGGKKEGPQDIIHVLGFQTTIDGKNYKLCFAINNANGAWFTTPDPEEIQL